MEEAKGEWAPPLPTPTHQVVGALGAASIGTSQRKEDGSDIWISEMPQTKLEGKGNSSSPFAVVLCILSEIGRPGQEVGPGPLILIQF
jgi:hypothetical protein